MYKKVGYPGMALALNISLPVFLRSFFSPKGGLQWPVVGGEH